MRVSRKEIYMRARANFTDSERKRLGEKNQLAFSAMRSLEGERGVGFIDDNVRADQSRGIREARFFNVCKTWEFAEFAKVDNPSVSVKLLTLLRQNLSNKGKF